MANKRKPKTDAVALPARSRLLPNHKSPFVGGQVKGNAGQGRPKGRQNRQTRKMRNEVKQSKLMPLDFMLQVLRQQGGQRYPTKYRMWAARTAAPYLHKKMPIAIQGTDGPPIAFADAAALGKLSASELKSLLPVLEKLGLKGNDE